MTRNCRVHCTWCPWQSRHGKYTNRHGFCSSCVTEYVYMKWNKFGKYCEIVVMIQLLVTRFHTTNNFEITFFNLKWRYDAINIKFWRRRHPQRSIRLNNRESSQVLFPGSGKDFYVCFFVLLLLCFYFFVQNTLLVMQFCDSFCYVNSFSILCDLL